MEGDEVREVEVGEGVSGNNQERVVLQSFFGVLDAPRGTEWLLLIGIGELHTELFAVTEVILDEGGEELDGHHGLVEPMPFEQPQHMLHDRPICHGQEWLGHA